ncbi:MAG: hypothetical protein RLY40_43 [Pseudomonadota bacterium]|jgi:ankyrin repeat protein
MNIFDAIEDKDIEFVKQYIAADNDINVVDEDGASCLLYSIRFNCKKIAKLLLEAGINIDIKDKYGKNALYYAKFFDNKDIVELLTPKSLPKVNTAEELRKKQIEKLGKLMSKSSNLDFTTKVIHGYLELIEILKNQ